MRLNKLLKIVNYNTPIVLRDRNGSEIDRGTCFTMKDTIYNDCFIKNVSLEQHSETGEVKEVREVREVPNTTTSHMVITLNIKEVNTPI